MSMERSYYVIAGYDLTGYETDKFKDWKWSEEGEDYINNQSKGEIQFFDDPMSGSYLYFGYVWQTVTSIVLIQKCLMCLILKSVLVK